MALRSNSGGNRPFFSPVAGVQWHFGWVRGQVFPLIGTVTWILLTGIVRICTDNFDRNPYDQWKWSQRVGVAGLIAIPVTFAIYGIVAILAYHGVYRMTIRLDKPHYAQAIHAADPKNPDMSLISSHHDINQGMAYGGSVDSFAHGPDNEIHDFSHYYHTDNSEDIYGIYDIPSYWSWDK